MKRPEGRKHRHGPSASGKGPAGDASAIESIHVRNYRTLRNVKLELSRLTVLLGPNGSGKSTVFVRDGLLTLAGA